METGTPTTSGGGGGDEIVIKTESGKADADIIKEVESSEEPHQDKGEEGAGDVESIQEKVETGGDGEIKVEATENSSENDFMVEEDTEGDGKDGEETETVMDTTAGESVTAETGGEETEETRVSSTECKCNLASENAQLRNAVIQLSERQAILEEFMEVESGDKFERFLAQRERLINIMGFSQKLEIADIGDGKKNPKSSELVGLLKLISAQASTGNEANNVSSTNGVTGAGKSDNRKPARHSGHHSSNSSTKRERDTCIRCYSADHTIDGCPHGRKRTPGDEKLISKRRQAYFQRLNKQR